MVDLTLDYIKSAAPVIASDYELEKEDPAGTQVNVIDSDLAAARRLFTEDDAKKMRRRADLHLLPLLILCYLVKNMDSNIPSYLVTMNAGSRTNILTQLNMTKNDYGYLSTIFTATYTVFEIPSNIIIKWSSPRLHFVRILAAWSIVEACTAACTNKDGLFACRALLGAFEAGLLPGLFYQLTAWYRPDELAIRLASLSVLGQFSGILDALLAFGLAYIDGAGGVSGWQWCYIILGVAGLVLAVAVYMFLPDYPDSPDSRRQFFTMEERTFWTARLPPNSARSTDANFDWKAIKQELKSPLIYGYAMLMLFEQSGTTGLTFWLPTVIAGYGLTSTANSQLLNIPPAVLYIATSLSTAYFIDHNWRFPRPVWMLGSMVAISGIFAGLAVSTNNGVLFALIMLAYIPHAIFQTNIYPLRAQTVRGSSSAAFAIAFQNTIGGFASLYAAQIFQSQFAPRYVTAFIICIAFFIAALLATAFTWYHMKDVEKETRRIAKLRANAAKKGLVLEEDVILG